MSYSLIISVIIILFAVIIGILNYSPADSIIYRKGVEFGLFESFSNARSGCFCLNNQLDKSLIKFGKCSNNVDPCTSEIIILNNKVYKEWVLAGDVGFGETYVKQYWTYNANKYDLSDILTEFILSVTMGDATIINYILKYLCIEQWYQWYDRTYKITKSLSEDKTSIEEGYDIGDDVYKSFLDDTMMYTCAIWDKQTFTNNNLKAAQVNKINILINKMGINNNDKVLDLGTGWGYVPYHINKVTNATTMGITMSKNQYNNNINKFKDAIKANNVGYKYIDYRNYTELQTYKFNKIISIGMMEHVGIKNIQKFWLSVDKILDSSVDNVIGLHYFASVDMSPSKMPVNRNHACKQQTFIWKYVFPGACTLYPDWINEYALKYDFNLFHQESYGFHYVKTLQVWREKWVKNGMNVIKNNPKYNDDLFKLYEFYLAISEAMFRTGHVTLWHQIYVRNSKATNRKSKMIDIEYIFDNFNIPHSH
eukprot:539806_1